MFISLSPGDGEDDNKDDGEDDRVPSYIPLHFANQNILLILFWDLNDLTIVSLILYCCHFDIFNKAAKGFWTQPAPSLLSLMGCFSTQRLGGRSHR